MGPRRAPASWAAYGALGPRAGRTPQQEQIEQARQMLSGKAPRAKSGAKASGICEDGPRAITGADKAEKANHNPNPRPRVTHA